MNWRKLWRLIRYGNGRSIARCPVCGRRVVPEPNSMVSQFGGGPMMVERPKGELERSCEQQNGTKHNVPIRW